MVEDAPRTRPPHHHPRSRQQCLDVRFVFAPEQALQTSHAVGVPFQEERREELGGRQEDGVDEAGDLDRSSLEAVVGWRSQGPQFAPFQEPIAAVGGTDGERLKRPQTPPGAHVGGAGQQIAADGSTLAGKDNMRPDRHARRHLVVDLLEQPADFEELVLVAGIGGGGVSGQLGGQARGRQHHIRLARLRRSHRRGRLGRLGGLTRSRSYRRFPGRFAGRFLIRCGLALAREQQVSAAAQERDHQDGSAGQPRPAPLPGPGSVGCRAVVFIVPVLAPPSSGPVVVAASLLGPCRRLDRGSAAGERPRPPAPRPVRPRPAAPRRPGGLAPWARPSATTAASAMAACSAVTRSSGRLSWIGSPQRRHWVL